MTEGQLREGAPGQGLVQRLRAAAAGNTSENSDGEGVSVVVLPRQLQITFKTQFHRPGIRSVRCDCFVMSLYKDMRVRTICYIERDCLKRDGGYLT